MKSTFADKYLPDTDIKTIYSSLQDDESRQIFLCRYEYLIERNNEKLSKSLSGFTSELFKLEKNCESIIIFGAGALSYLYTIPLFTSIGVKIKAICDSNKAGQSILDYNIISLEEALKIKGNSKIVISTFTEAVCKKMCSILHSYEVSNDSIVEPEYFILEDQYFSLCFIKPQHNEVFIDAGCMDAGTSLLFREFTKDYGYKRIYAFEPSPQCYLQCKKIINENEMINVTLINKGLWDSADTLSFSDSIILGGSTISNDGDLTIETVALDDVVDKDDKVTFIKMDVEGAELNALFGAKEIIKRDKPRLAICIYHKPEDIINIPSYILSLNSEYKLYIRHYSPIETETVLYAI